MKFWTAGAVAHAVLRPIQNVVDPSRAHAPKSRRLEGDIRRRRTRRAHKRVRDILESAAVRAFKRYNNKGAGLATDRDLFAFVAEPAKPKAQDELTHSSKARVDDKSSRSQFCVRLRLR